MGHPPLEFCYHLPMSGIEAFFSSLGKYSWRTLVGVFLASGTILFFSDRLNLKDWAQPLRGYLVGAFLLSGGVLLTYLVTTIHERLTRDDAEHIDLRIVVGDSLNTSWTIGQAPLTKQPMMILLCEIGFAHFENFSVIIRKAYLKGTRAAFAISERLWKGV